MRASNVHKEPQAQDRAASGTGSSDKMHKARKGDAVDGDDDDDEDDDGDDDDMDGEDEEAEGTGLRKRFGFLCVALCD